MILPTRANLMRLMILEKQSSWPALLAAVRNFAPKVGPALVRAPGQAGRLAKGTASALAMPFIAEMAVRGVGSGGRNFEPTSTTQLYRKLFDTGFRGSGLDSHLGNLANKATEAFHGTETADVLMSGLDSAVTKLNNAVVSPQGQGAVQAMGRLGSGLANLTNPATRADALAALEAGVKGGATEASAGVIQGALKGAARAIFGDPITAAAVVGAGALPVVVHSLATRKRREAEAKTNRLILEQLARREELPAKTASLLSILAKLKSIPTPRWLRHTPTMPSADLAALLAKAKGGGIPVTSVLKALHPHTGGWSLLNHPVSRNPLKSMLAAGGVAGVTKGLVNWGNPQEHANPAQSALGLIKDTLSGLSMPVRHLDYALFEDRKDSLLKQLSENPNLLQGRQLVDKTKHLVENVARSVSDNLAAPALPVPPTPSWLERNKSPLKWSAAGLGALMLPFAAGKLVNRIVDKRITREEAKRKGLQRHLFGKD